MWEALTGNLAFSDLQLLSLLLQVMERSAWIDLRPDTNADDFRSVPGIKSERLVSNLQLHVMEILLWQNLFAGSFQLSVTSCVVKRRLIMLWNFTSRTNCSFRFGRHILT